MSKSNYSSEEPIKNKYFVWYHNIILRSKCKQRNKGNGIYFENHHIIAKCQGGSNDKNNLVLLTAKEHFICHRLLTKIFPYNIKLKYAVWGMCTRNSDKGNHKMNSHSYQIARHDFSESLKMLWKDPEFRENQSIKLKENWKDPEYVNHISLKRKEMWKDMEFRENQTIKHKEKWKDPEYREKQSIKREEYWKDQNNRDKQSIKSREYWKDPEYVNHISLKRKEMWKDQEFRENQIIKYKEYWKDQNNRDKRSKSQINLWKDPEYRENITIKLKEKWKDPKCREEQSIKSKEYWKDQNNRENQSIKSKEYWKDPDYRENQTKKHSKTFILISPDKTKYIVDTGLAKFCKLHDLSLKTLRLNFNKGKIKKRKTISRYVSNTFGWEIIRD